MYSIVTSVINVTSSFIILRKVTSNKIDFKTDHTSNVQHFVKEILSEEDVSS